MCRQELQVCLGSKWEAIHGLAEGTGPQYLEPILHSGEGHVITVSPAGADKGVSRFIPVLLSYKGLAIVIDPKCENNDVTARARRKIGQHVIRLAPFNGRVATTKERGTFNPLEKDVELRQFRIKLKPRQQMPSEPEE